MKIKMSNTVKPTLSSLLRRRCQTLESWMSELSLKDATGVSAHCETHGLTCDVEVPVAKDTSPITTPVVEELPKPKKKGPRNALVEVVADEKKGVTDKGDTSDV